MQNSNSRNSGFTILEFEICLIVLTLGIMGMTRLVVDHTRLVADLEEWRVQDPVYYVVKADDDLERTLGRAATFADEPPPALPEPPSGTAYRIEVESVERQLYPSAVTATVEITPNEP